MIHRTGLFCLAILIVCLVSAGASETTLKIDPKGANHVLIKDQGNGEWEVRTTGNDPYFYVRTDGQPIPLEEQPMFSFDYFSLTGIGRSLVFVGPAVDIPHMLNVELSGREAWANFAVDMTSTSEASPGPVMSLRVTLGTGPGIVARLRSFRARPADANEEKNSRDREKRLLNDRERAARLRDYLARRFPYHLDSVSADSGHIVIKGTVGSSAEEIFLAEVPMWEDVTALKNPSALHPVEPGGDGRFIVTIDRASISDRESLLSSWILVRKEKDGFELLSASRYAEDQKPRADLPPAHPASLKGIGGCAFDHPDMQELGIASVTLNIILNHLFLPSGSNEAPLYEFAGSTWQINNTAVADLDRQMIIAAKHGWMVSAIVLIQPVGQSPEGAWIRTAAHPEANSPGIYVLPDFTTREGTNAYAAAMNFVTERYSRPDGKYGRVHHWIMHNEVNSGFFWANAGSKTDITYLDLYQKSMRVAHLLARQYDPHAKSFISLEHCWTIKLDSRSYSAKDLLDLLAAFSRKEGNFPWGIAFHPYPQEISNPRAWEDSQAIFDTDTPYLTYKNIEVLDAWARQPDVAFRGEPREIQLTEQGINSPDYSEKTLAEQAASMAYVWKKIEPLKTITAFQYHLWADDRGEGGLRLGLRKYSDDPADPHGIKPIWNLYKAIDTCDWETASQFAKPILGIRGWSEVQHRGPIAR